MKKRLLIVGGRGSGEITISLFEDINQLTNEWIIEGFLTDIKAKGEFLGKYKVIGSTDEIKDYVDKGYYINYTLHCTTKNKYERIQRFKALNLPLETNATVIHPRAYINPSTKIGYGVVICPFAATSFAPEIGNFVHLYPHSYIAHDSIINDYSMLTAHSITFVTTAIAFALRLAKIVWCDIREDTKNIDETKIEALITSRTRAIVVVHYGGVACEMDKISEICNNHKLYLVEDAAQAIGCTYKGKKLGQFGDLACLSFHETKNIQCGEGGALLVNNPTMVERAQIIRDKGTNRIHFEQGKVDKYTWVDIGSSYMMSELQAAFLYSQLQNVEKVNAIRMASWNYYYKLLSEFMDKEKLPIVPKNCTHNAHMFYIILDSAEQRKRLIEYLGEKGILAVFHYIPLHQAPYWKGKYDYIDLPVTVKVSDTLLRLPLYYGIKKKEIEFIVEKIKNFLQKI